MNFDGCDNFIKSVIENLRIKIKNDTKASLKET